MDKEVKDSIIFIIEFYKLEHNMTAKEVYDLFIKYDMFSYLEDCYEYLSHLGSIEAVIKDIDEVLETNGYHHTIIS